MTAMPETTSTRTVDHATFVIERNCHDDPSERERGTKELLDQLETALMRESASGADSSRARLS